MAVPSQVFVGITIFGLISALVLVPVTVLVVTCDPRAESAFLGRFGGDDCTVFSMGMKVFLTLASVLTIAFTVLSWKALLAGARRDAMRRARVRQGPGDPPT